MRNRAATLGTLVFIAALSGSGQAEPGTTAGSVVLAVGSATIYRQDVAGAQDRAVQAAMLRALESYRGLHLEARTLISDDALVRHDISARTRGFVRGYEILTTSRDGNVVHVRVRVELGDQPAPAAMRRLADGRTLLLVNTSGPGATEALSLLRHELSRPFAGSAVTLPTLAGDSKLLSARDSQAPDSAIARADTLVIVNVHTEELTTAARDIGYSVPSDLAFHVASSSASLMVLSGTNGEVLASHRILDRRGADPSDPRIAARHSVAGLIAAMRSFIAESLIEHLDERETSLRVVLRVAQGNHGRLRRLLENSRWTEEIEVLELSDQQVVFGIRARVPAALYVEELRGDPAVEIASFDAATAEVQLRLAR